jgi:hypothetical protein
MDEQNRAARKRSAFVSLCNILICPKNSGTCALWRIFKKQMNARSEIRNHLLVGKMKYWRSIAKCPLLNPRIPTWRARKNYWSLLKNHGALAAAHGLTATSVF